MIVILFAIGLFLAGALFALTFSVITNRAWLALLVCSVAMLLVFRDFYIRGRYDLEELVAALVIYGLTVLGAALGALLSFPFRRWRLLQNIRQN